MSTADDAAAHDRAAPPLPPPADGRVRITADDVGSTPVRGDASGSEDYYVDQLRRAQLRLSLGVALGFLAVLAVLAVAVAAWPLLDAVRPWGLPLSWWIIGFALYPLVLASAIIYQAGARRLERRYRRLARA